MPQRKPVFSLPVAQGEQTTPDIHPRMARTVSRMSLSTSNTIAKRIFVTGASRSGTTLLQSLLAGHSRIYTFPETGAFLRILGMRRRAPLALVGLSLGGEKKALQRLCDTLQPARLTRNQLSTCLTLKGSIEQVTGFLDNLALERDKSIWVEKTPRHFKYADILLRHVPRSHVLHILRDGRDVLASIYLRAQRYPDRFGKQGDLRYGIRLWNEAVRKAHALMDTPGHSTLIYEDLTRRPDKVLHFLCTEAGITFEPEMLRMSHDAYFIQGHEAWKRDTSTRVAPNTSKFATVFDKATRDWLEGKLRLDLYHELRRSASQRIGLESSTQTAPGKETNQPS